MEVFIFIALVVVIILLFNIKSRLKETEARTHQGFVSLKKELLEIKEATKDIRLKKEVFQQTDKEVVQYRPLSPSGSRVAEPVTVPPAQPAPGPVLKEAPASTAPQVQRQPQPPAGSLWRKWLDKNPDLEKFIGENLVNKIGITVLVLGIAFFVKYAIDQNWIKEAGRVAIGIGAGAVLIGIAHYLRNSYHSFSSVLAGGAIAVFYFTIAFAFHEYGLFSQTAAFVIMVVITIFAVLISLLYDKLELAVIAVAGGFITPFLLSTGAANHVVLFTYMLILNMGMVALAYFKRWPLINIISILFTIFIYGGWLIHSTNMAGQFLAYRSALLFASLFYGLFLGMGLVHNIRHQLPFKPIEFSLLLLISFSYYAAGMTTLHFWSAGAWQGIFTILLALVNFCLAWYFYRTRNTDKNLLYLLIGLTLSFISMAAPVQLHGESITLFWSAEFVLAYWLYYRSDMRIFKTTSLIMIGLSLISLLIDWQKAGSRAATQLPVIFVDMGGLVTNLFTAACVAAYAYLLRRQPQRAFLGSSSNEAAATVMLLSGMAVLLITGLFGVNLYYRESRFIDIANAWQQGIVYVFAIVLFWMKQKYRLRISAGAMMLVVAASFVVYMAGLPYATGLRNGSLRQQYSYLQFGVHGLSAAILLLLLFLATRFFQKNRDSFIHSGPLIIWLISLAATAFFSAECRHLYLLVSARAGTLDVSVQQFNKAGLTIVWAVCALVIMWLGMTHKFKTLRIISLSIFTLALGKLFLFDIRNISEGGKIAAFILLGILLLIISFMYQKLRKIIIDDRAV
jgi:uncharacterized membrane protein